MSRGFGFVEFEKPKHAKKALKKLNGKMLNGHKLDLSIAKQQSTKKRKRETESKEDVRTKLLIKNVAFEATTAELRELIANHGTIKSIRLPTKFSGNFFLD